VLAAMAASLPDRLSVILYLLDGAAHPGSVSVFAG
jgi:hypothetical protein